MIFDVNAIVMRTYDFSEADRIIILFTEQEGKVRAVAKGIRKSKSKLAGSLNLLTHTQIQLVGHEHRDLFRITQAQFITGFPYIKSDLSALAQASRVIELIDGIVHDRHPQKKLFDLLMATLNWLESGFDPRRISIWFETHFWNVMGYGLNVNNCYLCKQETEKMTFDLEAGGVVCHNCKPNGRFWISVGSRRLLDKLLTMKSSFLNRLQIQPQLEKEIRRFLDMVINYHLGKPLKSDGFVKSIDKLA